MATITFVARKVRLANTHNVLTRARPLAGTAGVGEAAVMDANGNWAIAAGTARVRGIFLGFTDGRLEGAAGDDAEVLMEGIVAGFDVDPGIVIYSNADGTLKDTGTTEQKVGIGLNDGLFYIRPDL